MHELTRIVITRATICIDGRGKRTRDRVGATFLTTINVTCVLKTVWTWVAVCDSGTASYGATIGVFIWTIWTRYARWTTWLAAVGWSHILESVWTRVATLSASKVVCVWSIWTRWAVWGRIWTTLFAPILISVRSVGTTVWAVVRWWWWRWRCRAALLASVGICVVIFVTSVTIVGWPIRGAQTSFMDSHTSNDDDDDESDRDSNDGHSTRDAIQPTSWHEVANRCLFLAYHCEM